ncbi:MAG TPA: 16S rRNA (adenine(1518)-N(6)/adenine(1519)-N(6))-dimethyltransferase RsmA [Verrucomicrobiae bacterium]|nr:16S rRNA (adenine(1518)-N(6)/adenine(1519)-N(6))-dimethyltransferase RsmA [Verrucomicrobiae bacterium]
MKQWLNAHQVRLTKSLGQNFLHDQNQLERIAAAAEIQTTDKILEVGPGLGPLTALLARDAGEVLALELDARLMEFLREKFAAAPTVRLEHGDGLQYVREHRHWAGWKLVANLPYSVASPLLVELAEAAEPPDRMVTTLQLEVAQRIDAAPDTEHYGVLGLLLGLRYESRGWFRIPRTCFFPEPDIDSACLTLLRRPEPLLPPASQGAFKKVVKRGFSQRRKMMFKLLKGDWPEPRLAAAFAQLGLSPQIRAEKVSLAQFVELTRALTVAAA